MRKIRTGLEILFLIFVPAANLFADSIVVPDGQVVSVPVQNPNDKTLHLGEIEIGKNGTLVVPSVRTLFIEKLDAQTNARLQMEIPNVAAGTDGVDAAPTRIFLKEISGHLKINAKGTDGANGIDGRMGAQGVNGKKGRDGRTLIFGIFIGPGEDGKAGGQGLPGESGSSGGRGGNGSVVDLYYMNKVGDASISVDVSGGRGGRGGVAGPGGIGGNGGPGGRGTKAGKQGPMGRHGVAGKPGKPGKSGEPGIAQVYQLAPPLYDCMSKLEARLLNHEVLMDEDYAECRNIPEPTAISSNSDVIIANSAYDQSSQEDLEKGIIRINASGSKGGDGPMAVGYGAWAPAGADGTRGGAITVLLRRYPAQMILSVRGGDGGRGGEGMKGAPGSEDDTRGGSGGRGGEGGQGGSGGSIRIVMFPGVKITQNLKLDLAAGDGGKGGRGGDGGNPGGPVDFPSNPGENGKEGLPGNDLGSLEVIQIQSLAEWIVREFKSHTDLYFPPTFQ